MDHERPTKSVRLRLYLGLIQTMVLAIYGLQLQPFAVDPLSPGLLLMSGAIVLVFTVPRAQLSASWLIGSLALGDLGILLSTLPPDMRNDVGMVSSMVLLLALVSYLSSIAHFAIVTTLLIIGYGLSLHHAGLLLTEGILSLVSLLGLTLVFLSKHGMFQTELERLTASQSRSRQAAMSDPLTGLPNRAQFLEHVSRAVCTGRADRQFQFAVLFIDLDGFKPINDRLGHKAGDAVLRQAAKLFQQCLRKGDVAGRYGGDEFTLLVHNVNGPTDAVRVADRILGKIQTPIDVGEPVKVGASIGIALSTNLHERAEDLIRDADSAMYRAKAQGKNRYVISDQAADLSTSELKERWKRLVQLRW